MTKSHKDITAQLAAVAEKAVNDERKPKAGQKKSAAKASPKPLTGKQESGGERLRSGINIPPQAASALRELERFLITDCGATSTNISGAISIALLMAVEDLEGNKARIQEMYNRALEFDGRRKQSA